MQSRLGLGHTFSRAKISDDVNRQDKPIIQSINLLDLLDKDINTFAMRIREWYSWHYPELARIVTDNIKYVQCVKLIGNRDAASFTAEEVEQIVEDGELAEKVVDSCLNSMGQEISDLDIQSLIELCDKTLKMIDYRTEMQEYLKDRMETVSPNLTSLIGENVAAKLIAHSGSLSTLAKYPASTIQILGAEKALFRALKQRTKTPKYGLLFNTSFIGRANGKNKGRVSRYLANKCAMAARLDHFLVNVLLFLFSLPTSLEKNSKNKLRENLSLLAKMRRLRSKEMKNLWKKSLMSSNKTISTSTLRNNTRRFSRKKRKAKRPRLLKKRKKPLSRLNPKRLRRNDHCKFIIKKIYLIKNYDNLIIECGNIKIMRSDKLINHNLSCFLENSLCSLSFIFNSNIEYELIDKVYSERVALLILQ